jgi:hypothetical protein
MRFFAVLILAIVAATVSAGSLRGRERLLKDIKKERPTLSPIHNTDDRKNKRIVEADEEQPSKDGPTSAVREVEDRPTGKKPPKDDKKEKKPLDFISEIFGRNTDDDAGPSALDEFVEGGNNRLLKDIKKERPTLSPIHNADDRKNKRIVEADEEQPSKDGPTPAVREVEHGPTPELMDPPHAMDTTPLREIEMEAPKAETKSAKDDKKEKKPPKDDKKEKKPPKDDKKEKKPPRDDKKEKKPPKDDKKEKKPPKDDKKEKKPPKKDDKKEKKPPKKDIKKEKKPPKDEVRECWFWC